MESWINYLIDEEGKDVIVGDGGFIAFINHGKEFHVTDFYVEESKRNSGVALSLGEKAEAQARDLDCERMTCNIFINKSNRGMFAHKVRIFSKFGFLPDFANNNAITMIKEL